MENCKDLDKLFGGDGIVVYFDNELSLTSHCCKKNYYFDGEQLMYHNGERSEIKYIFAYQDGEFTRLYKAPTPRPEIQTGDFVYYQSGGFDRLSSITKSNSYITEFRRPNTCCGFDLYSKMPLIWPEKN